MHKHFLNQNCKFSFKLDSDDEYIKQIFVSYQSFYNIKVEKFKLPSY